MSEWRVPGAISRVEGLALLWQIVADNSGDGIPKSVFQ
jgi:hypothetical protein